MKSVLIAAAIVGLLVAPAAANTLAKKSAAHGRADVPVIAADPPTPYDPIEPLNRATFALNDAIDAVIVNPIVSAWNAVLPSFVRTGVANLFDNLDDVYAGINHTLQGRGQAAATDFKRVAVNTTIGIGGFVDVGTGMGLGKTYGDFGQTLGVWGLPAGPYLILPLIGPSTLRETAGRTVRVATDPRTYLDPVPSYSLMAGEYVATRAGTRTNETLLAASSLDRYVFTRNLYLQKRTRLVIDARGEDSASAPHP